MAPCTLSTRSWSFCLIFFVALSSNGFARTAALPPADAAQSAGEVERLRADVESLRQGQAEIQKSLEEIKAMLRDAPPSPRPAPPAAAPNVTLDLAKLQVLGS